MRSPGSRICAIASTVASTVALPVALPILVIACGLLFSPTLRAQDTAAPTTTGAMPGTYSDSQAARGELWYASQCAACHPGRALAGADFEYKWSGRTALDLFDRIRNSMPLTAPGSLSRRTYTDIVAYLMRLNGLPAGTTALAADSLALRQARLTFDRQKTPSPQNTFDHR